MTNEEKKLEDLSGVELWVYLIHLMVAHLEVAIEAYNQREAGVLNQNAIMAHTIIKQLIKNLEINTVDFRLLDYNTKLMLTLNKLEVVMRKHLPRNLTIAFEALNKLTTYWEGLNVQEEKETEEEIKEGDQEKETEEEIKEGDQEKETE